MYDWIDRQKISSATLIVLILTVEIGQTVDQVKPKRWKCISLNKALSA